VRDAILSPRRVALLVLGALVLLAVLVLSGIALAVAASESSATAGAGDRPHALDAARSLGERALQEIDVTPQALGFQLRVLPARGQTTTTVDLRARVITAAIRPGDPAERVAHALAYQLGHAYDALRLDDAQRDAYLRARTRTGAPWRPPAGGSDLDLGAGDFAEVFALCHAAASSDFRSTLAPRPSDPCALLPAGAAANDLVGR
jgi:hypothetical protein